MLLEELRKEIDAIDAEVIELIGKRIDTVREIAKVKKQHQLPILDGSREEEIRMFVKNLAKKRGLSSTVMGELIELILDYSRIEMSAI